MHGFTEAQLGAAMDRAVDRCIHIDDVQKRTAAIRRAMLEEGIALACASRSFECLVPWLDSKPLINAVGTSEAKCHANLAMLNLDDDELQRVSFRRGTLQVSPEEHASESGTDSN